MDVTINGKKETLDQTALSVETLLSVKNVPDPDMVSVQINGDILEREDYGQVTVKNGDEIEFLYFMGGGGGLENA